MFKTSTGLLCTQLQDVESGTDIPNILLSNYLSLRGELEACKELTVKKGKVWALFHRIKLELNTVKLYSSNKTYLTNQA